MFSLVVSGIKHIFSHLSYSFAHFRRKINPYVICHCSS